jgi:hypothetical protein
VTRPHFSTILRIAGKGFQLAKYLKRSGVGMRNGMVRSMVEEILDLQREAADSVQRTGKKRPLFDVEIQLGDNGETKVEAPTDFDLV